MEHFFTDHSGVALGASVLVLVEVIPLHSREFDESLSSAFAKLHLQDLSLTAATKAATTANECADIKTRTGGLRIHWDLSKEEEDQDESDKQCKDTSGPDINHYDYYFCSRYNHLRRGFLYVGNLPSSPAKSNKDFSRHPTIKFLSENPLALSDIPCVVIGYTYANNNHHHTNSSTNAAVVTAGTHVRVLPGLQRTSDVSYSNLDCLCGETEACMITKAMEDEIRHSHNPETLHELHLRLSSQLSQPIRIGTTSDALWRRKKQQSRRARIGDAAKRQCQTKKRPLRTSTSIHQQTTTSLPSLVRDGALLVHDQNHGTGKTALVQYVARNLLKCDSVHVLQPGALLAKYGSYADAGLESTLHSIVLSAATKRNSSICIILDHLDAWMPSSVSGRSNHGDAAAPVLKAFASYLKMLVLSLKYRQEFPFPTKNPLHNVAGKHGYVLLVKVCLVAIVTCPDNGWRLSSQTAGGGSGSTCIFDVLPVGTYRLPSLTAATRLGAFRWAFAREEVSLTKRSRDRLPSLAASATWGGGNLHISVARMLRQRLDKCKRKEATIQDLKAVFDSVGSCTSGLSLLSMEELDEDEDDRTGDEMHDPFAFIGGSSAAKEALRDALTLDATKREMLQRMGIDPPIGILFYGPPGCGKTLLAKGVARLLGAVGASNTGRNGAFLSLNSSEIAQAEIGSSEKIIVSAFKSARENAPAVLFIDEFQALFVDRKKSGSGKLSSTLLQCMDDIKEWRTAGNKANFNGMSGQESSEIVVLGATNTPWMIDKAFLRPGRFDRIVHVGLPTQHEREEILKVHTSKMRILGGAAKDTLLCTKLAEQTNGFSGAELSALCRAAAVRCLLDHAEFVAEDHFLKELEESKGNSNTGLVERNESWKP